MTSLQCRKCKQEKIDCKQWGASKKYILCTECRREYMRTYMRTYTANKKKNTTNSRKLYFDAEKPLNKFECKQCKKCKIRKTISEEFTKSIKHCNKCLKQPRVNVFVDGKLYDMMRIKTHWTNPLAKQLYKQSLISNS